VLGGSYHWAGAIVGALVFTALPTIAQAIVPEYQDVAKGIVLLLIMIFLPRGLIDPRAIRLRRATRDALKDPRQIPAQRATEGAP
jgi:branched-chain amino acid transport system permease protein